jgi:hypothetical protein
VSARAAAPRLAAFAYIAAAALLFADYYRMVRDAGADATVDFTAAVLLLAALALPVGIMIGRLWGIAIPFAVFPIAVVAWLVGAFDPTYSDDAAERGGVVGSDWLGLAALIAVYAVPAAAFGVGLRELGRRARKNVRRTQC